MVPLSFVYFAAVAAFTAAAAISDWRTRRLPNWLTVPALAAALLMHTAVNGVTGLGFSLAGFATGFGLLLVLWLIGGGGGGDVKLMGALGAWLGANRTVSVFLVSAALAAAAAAAIYSAGMLSQGIGFVRRRSPATGSARQPGFRNRVHLETAERPRRSQRLFPFAVPVALGTWLVLAVTWHASELPW